MMKKFASLCLLLLLPFIGQAAAISDLLDNVSKDPMKEFARWQQTAQNLQIPLLDKASLATVDKNNYPQQRFMHISKVNDKGFVFSTHSHTPKVAHFQNNKKASLIFLWQKDKLYLQVRVSGEIEQLAQAKTRSTENNIHQNFYDYVLKPEFIQFAVVDKSKDIVTNDYLNYSRNPNGNWEMQRTDYTYSKVTSS